LLVTVNNNIGNISGISNSSVTNIRTVSGGSSSNSICSSNTSFCFLCLEKFAVEFRKQAEEKNRREAEERALLTGDPFDPEVDLIYF